MQRRETGYISFFLLTLNILSSQVALLMALMPPPTGDETTPCPVQGHRVLN
jgi:hypothetical protein